MTARTGIVHVKNLSEKQMVKYVKGIIQYLVEDLPKGLKKTDTDLINIRDEMLAEMNQLLYLFTLH